jgi:hypothetical protein
VATTTFAGATWTTAAGNKTVTATPAANDLIVVVTANSGRTTAQLAAITDNNSDGLGAYDRVAVATKGTNVDSIGIYVRRALIGSATSTVFTATQSSDTGGGLVVYRISGMTLVGGAAVRGIGAQNNVASGTPSLSLTQAALTGNPLIGAVFTTTNGSANSAPPTSWTEGNDQGYTTPASGIETVHRSSGFTSATVAWTAAAPSAFCSIAVELDASGAPSSQTLNNGVEGSNATALTQGSGGNTTTDGNYFDIINKGGSGDDITFDTAIEHRGNSSAKSISTATGGEYMGWTTQWTDQAANKIWVRAYIYITTLPSTAARIIRIYDAATAEMAYVRLGTSGKLGINDSASQLAETTGSLGTGAWHRVEAEFTIGVAGTCKLRWFTGANLEGTTADEEVTLNNANTIVTIPTGRMTAEIRYGSSTAGTVAYWDDMGVTNVGWLGPRFDAILAHTADAVIVAGSTSPTLTHTADAVIQQQGRTATHTADAVLSAPQTLSNYFDGTDGTVLTAGSGGNTVAGGDYFDTVNGSGAGDTIEFDTARFHSSPSSALLVSTTTGNEYVEWTTQLSDTALTVYVRAYIYVATGVASSADKFIRLYDSNGTEVAFMAFDSTPRLRVGDSAGTFTEASVGTFATGTWYRLEMAVPIGNSVTINARLFTGANIDGTSPDHAWAQVTSDTNVAAGNIASVRFGNSIAGPTISLDDVAISTSDWLGPYVTATTRTVTHTADAIVQQQGRTVTHTADAILQQQGRTVTHTADAVIQKQGLTVAHTADALLKATLTVTHTATAVVVSQPTKTHTADAIIQQQGRTVTHTADALRVLQPTVTHTATAVVQQQGRTVQHTADAALLATRTVTQSADAVVVRGNVITHSADAVVKQLGRTVAHTADAVVATMTTRTVTHTATAVIQQLGRTATHTADAVVRTTRSVSHTADAKLYGDPLADATGLWHLEDQLTFYGDLRNWTVNQGTPTFSNGEWTLLESDSIISPPMPVPAVAGLYATATYDLWTDTAAPDFTPSGGYFAGTGYYGADGTTLVFNDDVAPGPYQGNGNAGPLPLNTWQEAQFAGFTLGANVHFVRFVMTNHATLVGDTLKMRAFRFRLMNLSITGDGSTGIDLNPLGTEPTWHVQGINRYAVEFAGTTQFQAPNVADFNYTGDVSVAAWVKTSGAGTDYRGVIGMQQGGPYGGNYWLGLLNNVPLAFSWADGGHSGTATAINDNQWHHLALTVEGTTGRLYVDGAEVWSGLFGHATAGTEFALGGHGVFAQNYTGYLDEAAVWNRALLPEEVAVLHSRQQERLWWHTADAVVQQLGRTVAHTADAVLRATRTVQHTADAVVQQLGRTATHTADAVLLTTRTATHTANAHLVTTPTKAHTADAIVQQQNRTVAHTADAHVVRTSTVTHTANAVVQQQGRVVTHAADTLLRATRTLTHTADALLTAGHTVTHSADAVVQQLGRTAGHTADAHVVRQVTVTHTATAVIQLTATAAHTASAVLLASRTATHTADALLLATRTTSHLADAVAQATRTAAHSADAVLIPGTFTPTVTHTASAVVVAQPTVTHTANAVVQRTATVTHTATAHVVSTPVAQHTATAVLQQLGRTLAHTADAVLLATRTASQTADALLLATRTASHLADAVLRRTATVAHTADAVLLGTRTATHTADAYVVAGSQVNHSADAILKRLPVLVQEQTAMHTYNTPNVSISVTMASVTAGNLLILAASADKDSGAWTLPAGFTAIESYNSANVSGVLAYKVATGGETTLTVTTAINEEKALWVAEYDGFTSTPFDTAAEADSGTGNVTSQGTGTTATPAWTDEYAFGIVAIDSGALSESGRAWTNGFVERIWLRHSSGSGAPSLGVAVRPVFSFTSGVTTTYSTTGTADQMYGAVGVFKLGDTRTVTHTADAVLSAARTVTHTATAVLVASQGYNSLDGNAGGEGSTVSAAASAADGIRFGSFGGPYGGDTATYESEDARHGRYWRSVTLEGGAAFGNIGIAQTVREAQVYFRPLDLGALPGVFPILTLSGVYTGSYTPTISAYWDASTRELTLHTSSTEGGWDSAPLVLDWGRWYRLRLVWNMLGPAELRVYDGEGTTPLVTLSTSYPVAGFPDGPNQDISIGSGAEGQGGVFDLDDFRFGPGPLAPEGTFSTAAHVADAVLISVATPTVGHAADAVVKGTFTRQHTADAVVVSGRLVTHSADAVLRGARLVSHTADAHLTAGATATHSADAVVRATATTAHTADAVLRRTATVAHTADLALRATRTATHNADARVASTSAPEVAHTADAVIQRRGVTTAHTADAVLQAARTVAHTTSAVLQASRTAEHTTDAVIIGAFTRTHGADAVVQGTADTSHTADAVIIALGRVVAHTADAFIRSGYRWHPILEHAHVPQDIDEHAHAPQAVEETVDVPGAIEKEATVPTDVQLHGHVRGRIRP